MHEKFRSNEAEMHSVKIGRPRATKNATKATKSMKNPFIVPRKGHIRIE